MLGISGLHTNWFWRERERSHTLCLVLDNALTLAIHCFLIVRLVDV